MCGRFTAMLSWTEYVALARVTAVSEADVNWKPNFNVAPTDVMPVVRLDRNGRREIAMLRWGLIPFWAKDEKIGYSTINARSEEVATKPTFKEAFKARRGLVLADGFYEWKKLDGKTKQPYRITLGNGGPSAFAGLWDRWAGGPEPIESFTIITTVANELVAEIHDRMPVIIDPSDYDTWLGTKDPAEAQSLLKPFPADRMKAHPVSSRVGNVKNNDPQLIDAVAL